MSDLGRKTAGGAALNVSVILLKTVLQFAVVLPILARVLPPAEFGLVGMAMAFVTFFTMFNDMGISAALVRAKAPSRGFWSSAFWINLGLGSALTALTYFSAPAIAAFYGQPMVEPLTRALAFILLMHCLFLVPMAWLQREFKFRTIAAIDLTATLLSAVAAVWMAVEGYGVWSLVAQQLVQFGVKMVGGLAFQRAPLGLAWDAREIIEVLPFSLRLTGTGFIGFINRQTDNILIGKFLGAEALGFYGRAYQVMLVPVNSLSLGAGFALYPAMASLQSEMSRFSALYLRALGLIAAVTLPMMTGLAMVADPFVALVFGPGWEPVVPVLAALSFAGIVQAVIGITNVMWKALGQSEVLLHWAIIRMFGFVGAFAYGVWTGSIAVLALSYLAVNLVLFLPFQMLALHRVGIATKDFIAVMLPSLVSTSLMAAAIWAAQRALPQIGTWESYSQLALLVPLGILVYGIVMASLFPAYVRGQVQQARALLQRQASQPEAGE